MTSLFSEIYIHISLANTHEGLGNYQKSILIFPLIRSPRRLPSGQPHYRFRLTEPHSVSFPESHQLQSNQRNSVTYSADRNSNFGQPNLLGQLTVRFPEAKLLMENPDKNCGHLTVNPRLAELTNAASRPMSVSSRLAGGQVAVSLAADRIAPRSSENSEPNFL